jgi:hypothetical protein
LTDEVVDRTWSRRVVRTSVSEEVVADDPSVNGQHIDYEIPQVEVQPYAVHEDKWRAGAPGSTRRPVRPEVGAVDDGTHPSVNPISSMSV